MSEEVSKPDRAGVVLPPPLIFLGSMLIGWLIHRQWPIRLVPHVLSPWLGIALTASSVILVALSFREFRRAKTSPRPEKPTTAIIREGPYGYTRNPLYVAMSLLHLGVSLWVNSLFMLLMLLPALAVISRGVIDREERYLEKKFGKEYLDYKASVRRWV